MREPDFEASADMRLLELQRGALGLPARDRHAWESRSTDGSLPHAPAPQEQQELGAVLAVEANAHPSDGVIAGAVVTLSLAVANEGTLPARDVVAAAPLPGGAAYRPGSFLWNGRSAFDDVAETFFGSGLAIGALGPGERATFQWKIGVRLGVKPLVVASAVRASGAAVLGARSLLIGRRAQTGSGAFSSELSRADTSIYEAAPLIPVEIPATELPIYELDEEEALVAEAAAAALSTAAPKAAEPATTPQLEPEPEAVPEPQAAPATAAPVPREGIVLYGRFDRATLAFFERAFFGSKPPTILQHAILSGALACPLDTGGEDAAGLKHHLDAQSQVLHRIGLHEKLGKKEPIAQYAGEFLARLDRLRSGAVPPQPDPPRDALLLVSELSAPTVALLGSIAAESTRWDFVKARQLTLALQAERAAFSGADRALLDATETALRAYAQASVAMLQKLFVRMRIDRTTGVLFQSEPALDTAAKRLIAAFKLALP